MHRRIFSRSCATFLTAALLAGAVCFFPSISQSGSCCGGGGGAGLLLPKYAQGMIDVSFDLEKYDGFWDQEGTYLRDPAGSDLRQYRLNTGYARRFSPKWQASVLVPYVWNANTYASATHRKEGPGDTTLNIWYEALDDTTAWRIREVKDLKPSIILGPSLVIPTGISPYDGTPSDEVTGRGFYRLDGNIVLSKTLHPWTASCSFSYGTYLERPVNREVDYVPPYRKKLGARSSASLSLSYRYILDSGGDALTGTASVSELREGDATRDHSRIVNTGFKKEALNGTIAYSSTDHDWGLRAGWNHTVKRDQWGQNFPATDTYTLGVTYGFR